MKDRGLEWGVLMDKEHLLTTKLIIDGQFHDFQLYSGKFYLWTNKKELKIYNWNKWLTQLAYVDRPIYLEPQPTEQLHVSVDDLAPFLERTLSFSETIYDSALFNHTLYFSDYTGFYRLSLTKKDTERIRIWEQPVYSISLSTAGRMALSAGDAGLYEYLLSTQYYYEQLERQKVVRIFQLSSHFASHATWDHHNLIQYGKDPVHPAYFIQFNERKGQLHVLDCAPIDSLAENSLHEQLQEYPLPLSLDKPSMQDGYLFSFEMDRTKIKKNALYRSKSIRLELKSAAANDQRMDFSSSLIVDASSPNFKVTLQNKKLLELPAQDVLKFRIYTRTRNYRNQLHILKKESLELYIFSEIKR